MRNYQGGLMEAKKAFYKDIKSDRDFIKYKVKSFRYGVIIAGTNIFMLDKAGMNSQQTIVLYKKEKKA